MVMNDKGRAWEEVIMAYFKVVDNQLSYEDMKLELHKYVMCYFCTNML